MTFSVSGGVPPYVLTLTHAVPPGMAFDPNTWVLSGTPTTGGSYSVDFNASDQAGDFGGGSAVLPVPDIVPLTLSDGAIGLSYFGGFSALAFTVNNPNFTCFRSPASRSAILIGRRLGTTCG